MTLYDPIIMATFKCKQCGDLYRTAMRRSQLDDPDGFMIMCPICEDVVPAELVNPKIKAKPVKEKIVFT